MQEIIVSRTRRIITLLLAICSTFFCSGLPFGFAGIYSAFVDAGVFSNLCPHPHIPCESQELRLSFIFSLGTALLNIAGLPSGTLLDFCGPKITAVFASAALSFGLILFALGDVSTTGSLCYALGFPVISVMGQLCFIPCISFANYFPKNSGLVTSMFVGSFDASSLVFVLLAGIYWNFGVSMRHIFLGYAIIPFVLGIAMAFIYPWHVVHLGQIKQPLREKTRPLVVVERSLEHLNFWQQVRTWQFILAAWALSVYMVRINFFIQTIANQVTKVPETADFKTLAFSLMLPAGGVVSIPLIGYVTDKYSLATSWFVMFASFLAFEILFAIRTLFDPYLCILSFVFFVACRPLLYTLGAVHMSRIFGFQTFGRLYGLLFTIAGLTNLLQYPLDYIAQAHFGGSYDEINAMLLIPHASTLLLPFYLAWNGRPRAKG